MRSGGRREPAGVLCRCAGQQRGAAAASVVSPWWLGSGPIGLCPCGGETGRGSAVPAVVAWQSGLLLPTGLPLWVRDGARECRGRRDRLAVGVASSKGAAVG